MAIALLEDIIQRYEKTRLKVVKAHVKLGELYQRLGREKNNEAFQHSY
jgi:hypothetical protein